MLGILSLTLLAGAAAVPCESLRGLTTDKAIVTAALVEAGPFTPPARGGGARGGRQGAAQPDGARGAAPAPDGAQARGRAAGRQNAGPAQPPQPLPQHCRVTMVLKPTSDSNINAELWLPA